MSAKTNKMIVVNQLSALNPKLVFDVCNQLYCLGFVFFVCKISWHHHCPQVAACRELQLLFLIIGLIGTQAKGDLAQLAGRVACRCLDVTLFLCQIYYTPYSFRVGLCHKDKQ